MILKIDSRVSKRSHIAIAAFVALVVCGQSCKNRDQKKTDHKQSGAQGADMIIVMDKTDESSVKKTEELPSTPSGEIPDNTIEVNDSAAESGQVPKAPGGPVAGIVALQDGQIVTELKLNKATVFKPTEWTRDTSISSGCETHKGILQASWTIGSRSAVDVQRFAGQECRDFNYSGTFAKEGKIVIQLDVVSAEGEQAHAEVTYNVTP